MNRQQSISDNCKIQIALCVAPIVAIASYFFNYFKIPILDDAFSAFFDADFGSSMGVLDIIKIFSESDFTDPLVYVVFALLFVIPVLLLIVSIVFNLIDIIKDDTKRISAILSIVAGSYLFISNLFIGIYITVANSQASDELGDFSLISPDLISVGFMWWVQLIMAVITIITASILCVRAKRSSNTAKPTDVALIGVKGQYKDCIFKINGNDRFILGRDPSVCNIVFNESESKISRKHCVIYYDYEDEKYIVTDYSSNGTYIVKGNRKSKLPCEVPTPIPASLYIEIGNENNVLKLN